MYKIYTVFLYSIFACVQSKLFRVMKLTIILLIVTFMQVSADTYAQKVSLNKKNASMREVIEVIQSQTGYSFIISSDLLRRAAPVNIDLKDIPLKEALDQSFKGQP